MQDNGPSLFPSDLDFGKSSIKKKKTKKKNQLHQRNRGMRGKERKEERKKKSGPQYL